MNNIFDISRFGLLLGKHWSENRNKYLLSLGAILALLLLWMGFLMIIEARHPLERNVQIATYYVGLFLTGALFASLLFSDLANKPKAINFMSVPASHLEKLLCMVVYCVVVYFVCYTVLFYVADVIMVKVANAVSYEHWQENQLYLNGELQQYKAEKVVNVFYNKDFNDNAPFNVLLFILTIFLTVQGAYALGSIYFPNYSFIKTTIALLLIILLFVLYFAKVLHNFMPSGNFDGKLAFFRVGYTPGVNTQKVIYLPEWYRTFMKWPARYILLLVFWVTAYYRLKEKEV